MSWTDEQVALQESTREFVRREVTPHLQEWEDACEVPRSLHLAAAKAGLLGVSFPEEVGGQGGTLLDSVALQEAFFEAGGSSGLAAALFTGGIALPHMAAHGTPDQIDAFVRPTLAGEKIGSLAVTEPGGGSDVAGITTTAVRDGDSYVVNGAKTFITSGVRADFVTTAVRTGGPGHAGVSLLVVEKGTPGFTRRPVAVEDGLALLRHRRAVVRRRARPGLEPGGRRELRLLPDRRAVRRRADRPGGARLRDRGPLAGADRGVLPGARDVRQAADRQPGGAAQARRHASACRGGAGLHPRDRRPPRRGPCRSQRVIAEACLAKQTAVEACDHVVDQAVQLHGGTGYMHGTEVERHYRDARILGIGGGATEVLTDLSARLLGYTP